jgi:hypothetical protein
MVSRLLTSCRFGNLAEHLGVLLLKGIAAVADVPRPEDVGIDAVANLLRRDDDGNSYAEDSFFVQLKSESEKTLEYCGHELKWFLGQSLPMFIGRVSLADARISLYPTLFVNQAVMSLYSEDAIVHFGPSSVPPLVPGLAWSPWAGRTDTSVDVWLGDPLMQWTVGDMTDRQWSQTAYQILKRFLEVVRRAYEHLSFKQTIFLSWSTNDKDSIRSDWVMAKGHPDEIREFAERCAPCLRALMLQAVPMSWKSDHSLALPLMALAAKLRDLGVEIDVGQMCAKMYASFLARSSSDGADRLEEGQLTDEPPAQPS